jgi:hypothetical protein
MLVENVLPGYYLMRAVKGCEEWPKGYYGLVRCNDPDFVWKEKPITDPTFHIPDKKLEKFLKNDVVWKKSNKFHDVISKIRDDFVSEPRIGHELILACMKNGYRKKEHGDVLCWLFNHMAEKMKLK